MKGRNSIAHLIAGLGGVIVLTELLRYWWQGHDMEGSVIAIGAAFGFVGAYMSDRKGALEGGGFLVDATTRIIQVVRSGRRSTDTAVVVEPTPPVIPVSVPANDPSITLSWKSGKEDGLI